MKAALFGLAVGTIATILIYIILSTLNVPMEYSLAGATIVGIIFCSWGTYVVKNDIP